MRATWEWARRFRAWLGTLHGRVVWTSAVGAAVGVLVVVVALYWAINNVEKNTLRSDLDNKWDVVAATMKVGAKLPDQALQDTAWIYGPTGELLSGPNASDAIDGRVAHYRSVTSAHEFKFWERAFYAAPVRASDGTVQGVVVVVQSTQPFEHIRITTFTLLGVFGGLVLIGTTFIIWFAVRRTFAPLQSMATSAREWSEHDLDARFSVGRDDEISQFGGILNGLLDRVAGALRSEQRLTSELAHELRTPLTAIRGEAELALLAHPDSAERTRLERIVDLVDVMSNTITTLLEVARTDTWAEKSSRVDAVVASTVDALDLTDDQVTVRVPQGLVVAAPAEFASRALAPLLENAVRYAATKVTVSAVADESVRIVVSDDGPGVQGDVFASHGGLGLALSRRLAQTLGGSLQLTRMAHPTEFTLTLPRG